MTTRTIRIPQKDAALEEAVRKTAQMLWGLRYGSVTLVVQDGKVLQIDKTEKFRFNNQRH
ncbi:YezD family protein [Geomesophilobacter sediminis]|uniref:YezD family protein n=1 Tax=Geomesophilobacter sediminis TaxID=2798584 RepID=A0A8J7SDU4_9BACT|nr:YezD family protein [Geomesophilobacter sediminis]MBJ6727979.1 YezD family protein [Geomesophilobacter sediminis]